MVSVVVLCQEDAIFESDLQVLSRLYREGEVNSLSLSFESGLYSKYDRSKFFFSQLPPSMVTSIFLCFPIADKKQLSGKRTKTENSESASVKLENSSLEKTTTFKTCGKNLSNYWLMKSEPESRLEKGIDMKVRLDLYSVMLWRWVGQLRYLLYRPDDLEPTVKGKPASESCALTTRTTHHTQITATQRIHYSECVLLSHL